MLPKLLSWRKAASLGALLCGIAGIGLLHAAPGDSNISVTRHNLSISGKTSGTYDATRPLATAESQICVFCHTPHNANVAVSAPLWNRAANGKTYTRYTSASLDANNITNGFIEQPAGSSLLCLSCHDGTVALGEVRALPRSVLAANPSATSIPMSGDGKAPAGYGVNTGFTRIGNDLTNDHPISITYNSALVTADGELAQVDDNQRDIGTSGALIGVRTTGYRPLLPLEPTGTGGLGQVQCATCHDPHLDKEKFLRLNRLQKNAAPTGGAFSQANDIICLACHTKLGDAWAKSAHADSNVADEAYKDSAAKLRNFPLGTKVWQASCLNCHDTHTVQGSRRLLREGVGGSSGTTADGAVYQLGFDPQAVDGTDGNNLTSAVENTCFQCHRLSSDAARVINAGDGMAPAIKSLFDLTYGMPARSDDQADPNNKERHNIKNADLTEPAAGLGRLDNSARHAECPDCHNPHRLIRNAKFNSGVAGADNTKRTHSTGSGAFSNVASGVLRGGWGVQPVYNTNPKDKPWPTNPDSYDVKKGDPAAYSSVAVTENYLTREYQLCFKCHSDYSNGPNKTDFPMIGYAAAVRGTSRRGTPLTYANGMTRYTNVAAEFASVNAGVDANGLAISGTDQGENTTSGTACGGQDCIPSGSVRYTGDTTNGAVNHRSWHPVMYPTGRDRVERGMSATGTTNIRAPFEANMGKQTMYCADCHGQGSSYTPGVGPVATEPQGPHGSQYPFLLRGDWSPATTKIGSLTNQICGYCHQPGSGTASTRSGFGNSHNGGGQGAMNNAPCMFCHIAVPHGWKNKAFLVNNNCVGIEGGLSDACNIINTAPAGGSITTQAGTSHSLNAIYIPPYYNAAKNRLTTWTRSGQWNSDGLCNGKDNMTSCGSTY